MASNRIKGITIEIGGDTTKLTKALSNVDNAISRTKTNLRDINNALKFDTTNVELLKDKQQALAFEIENVEEKIKQEKEALEQMKNTEGFDANSEAARNLKTQIDLDESALKQLKKEAKESASVIGSAFKAAGEKIQEVGNKVKNVGDSIASVGQSLTTKLTTPIVAAGTVAVTKFAEVDKVMQLTNATMGNTAEEADLLNKAMEEAAANSTFGMSDAAQATLNFARAGLDAKQAAAALAPAMNLAAGEGGELDTVSAGLVATINGFGDSFDQTTHYADVFANACNNSALDVNSLSESLSIAAPIFNAAGYSIEDAALYMGTMANAGIDADTAANALKTGMARLVSPAKEGSEWMEKLGIEITNADGSMKDSLTVQKELHDAFSTLSESEQIAAASAIFGKNQMSNWLALINTAPADVQSLSDALMVEGTTMSMAEAMMSGFGGSIESLKSSLDVLMVQFGRLIGEYLAPFITKIQEVVDKITAMDDAQKQHIIQILAIVAAVGPLLLIVGKIIVGIGTLISAIGTITTAIGGFITFLTSLVAGIKAVSVAFYALTGPIGVIILAITAVVTAVVLLWNNCEWFRNGVIELWENVKTIFTAALEAIKQALQNAGNNIRAIWTAIKTDTINTVNNLKAGLIELWNNIKTFLQTTVENIKSNITTAFENIKSTITDKITGAKDAIINGMQAACDFIADLPGKFLDWGSEMIQGLIDGIRSKISAVGDAVKSVADAIAGYIHFSEPDVGPLSNFHTFMPDMIKEMVQGINQGIPQLENAMNGMATALVPSAGQLGSVGSKVINLTIPITVNGAQGQDVSELADIIQDRINQAVYSQEAVFA